MKNTFLTIPVETFNKISSLPKQEQSLFVYMYYLNLARIQKTHLVHTTIPLTIAATGWGRLRVVHARNHLKEIGLIEDFRPTCGGKTYVKMNELEVI